LQFPTYLQGQEAAMARMSRRAFLSRSAATALAVSGGVLLSACGQRDPTGVAPGAGGAQLASPDNPVTWPVPADAGRIADGLAPEQGATLRVYNWSEYIYKKVVQDFEKKYKKYDVKVQVSTYGNMDEAVAKLRAGQVAFDVLFPTYDYLGKLVQGNFLRPLNHSYIPNIEQVWPAFQNPWYDQGWNYSVPYTIYSTGIAWRVDKVSDDIAKLPNPYEALWDERCRGKVGILDDYREAIGMTLLKNGITDLNTANQDPPQPGQGPSWSTWPRRSGPGSTPTTTSTCPRARRGSPRPGRATWSTPSTTCPRVRAPTSCATGSRPTARARSTAT
jgi:spermidine/putrescine transport system substrate-binding protein